MTCATCENDAILCGTCVEAGNLSLKQSLIHEQARVANCLKIIESHMPCFHGVMDNPNCPYCQIRLALVRDTDNPLLEVIKCLIEANDLRKTNREDTIGVLMRCGAFRHVDVAHLSRQIDNNA